MPFPGYWLYCGDIPTVHLIARPSIDVEGMRAYLADVGGIGDDARALFGPASWWGMKLSSARWLDFVKSARGQDVPRNLADVVAEISGRLAPILEDLP